MLIQDVVAILAFFDLLAFFMALTMLWSLYKMTQQLDNRIDQLLKTIYEREKQRVTFEQAIRQELTDLTIGVNKLVDGLSALFVNDAKDKK